eukprot:4699097-Amphidinium_carterae.1
MLFVLCTEDTQWRCYIWWFAGQWWYWEVDVLLAACAHACVVLQAHAQASGHWTGHWLSEFGSVYDGCNPQQALID